MFADDRLSPSRRALGQVIEWLVWAAVVGHSDRITHVFLPLDDRGVDGIVRRVDDEAMCAVQVKGRTSLRDSELSINVRCAALEDTHVTFVFAALDPVSVTLRDTMYVMDAATVLSLGSVSDAPTGAVVAIRLPYPPHAGSRWAPYACSLSDLPARLVTSAGVSPPAPSQPPVAFPPITEPRIPPPPRERELLGHLAELEVMRLLGEPPTLNTFKSFPDLEEAEYLVRHRPSGTIRGVQVKCLVVPDATTRSAVAFHGPSFVASPLTDAVILCWRHDLGGFDDTAWIIPTIDLPQLASTDGYTILLRLSLSSTHSRFDAYRVKRTQIATLLAERAAAGQ
ncbi:MAG: hypothetical protein JF887_01640 [Candidatus Dormibacteraeota bacterium]|uniref:Uncharacterized protein n=1 Tax=Candidatus Amunia macphersoniae TaxID=3127014 RepID=A0A934KKC9_9BACT|nr:hypothetical protein [Candidatus Dormibacteraeota bacterium]